MSKLHILHLFEFWLSNENTYQFIWIALMYLRIWYESGLVFKYFPLFDCSSIIYIWIVLWVWWRTCDAAVPPIRRYLCPEQKCPVDPILIEKSERLVIDSLLLNINKILLSYILFVSYSALNTPSHDITCQYSICDRLTVIIYSDQLHPIQRDTMPHSRGD